MANNIEGWIPEVLANGKTIWTKPDPPKQQPRTQQQQIDVSTITADQLRQRAQERHDNEQKLRWENSHINHAHQSPQTKEEIAAAEAERRAAFEYRQERLRQVMH